MKIEAQAVVLGAHADGEEGVEGVAKVCEVADEHLEAADFVF